MTKIPLSAFRRHPERSEGPLYLYLAGCPILSRSESGVQRLGYRLRKQTTALLSPPTSFPA